MSDNSSVSEVEVQEGGGKWIPVSYRKSKSSDGRAAVGLGQTGSTRPMDTEVSVTKRIRSLSSTDGNVESSDCDHPSKKKNSSEASTKMPPVKPKAPQSCDTNIGSSNNISENCTFSEDRPVPVRSTEVHNKVIIIKFQSQINNPRIVRSYLHRSIFDKYIVPYSLRILGNGNGVRFEVNDPNNKLPSNLSSITSLNNGEGEVSVPVRCWFAGAQSKFRGKISPVDVDVSVEYLSQNLVVLGNEHSGVDIVNVVRPRNKNGNLTLSVFLDFHLTVPKKVALDGFVYNVSAYKRPPLRCFRCLQFAHGTLTCTAPHSRCRRCCDIHSDDSSCNNPVFCKFCGGDHWYYDNTCPVNVKANEIERKKLEGTLTEEEARKAFRFLNNNVFNRPSSTILTARPRPNSSSGNHPSLSNLTKPSTSGSGSQIRTTSGAIPYSTVAKSALNMAPTCAVQTRNRYETLTDDSDFYNSDVGKFANSQYRLPSHKSRHFHRSNGPSGRSKVPPLTLSPPKNKVHKPDDHSYATGIANSPGYRSAVADPSEQSPGHLSRDTVLPSFVFKFIYSLFDIYFNSPSVSDSIQMYEDQCNKFLTAMKNSR